MSIARLAALLLALAALVAGCGGGDDEKSDEDKAADVAKQYVHSASNREDEKCRDSLASGVDPKLCGDLRPLAARNNPEKKKVTLTGSTAVVTVTGAGPVLLDVSVVKQGDDWKVKSWKGYAPGQQPQGGADDDSGTGGAAPPDTDQDSGSAGGY